MKTTNKLKLSWSRRNGLNDFGGVKHYNETPKLNDRTRIEEKTNHLGKTIYKYTDDNGYQTTLFFSRIFCNGKNSYHLTVKSVISNYLTHNIYEDGYEVKNIKGFKLYRDNGIDN